MKDKKIIIATRGSTLALAQANMVRELCRKAFPKLETEIKIIKTTGDKLQKAAMAASAEGLPKGLFTKELEIALLRGRVDMAVHSLKDLPTDLPAGLKLAAVLKRADAKDTLICRDEKFFLQKNNITADKIDDRKREFLKLSKELKIEDLPLNTIIGTTSTRRKAQLLARRADFVIKPIRGNVVTRLQKLAEKDEFEGLILAWAGLERLNFSINKDGYLTGDAVPEGLFARKLDFDEMLPCVGQAAIGIEIREDDERLEEICRALNHYYTFQCVTAERAFLKAMGGGCQAPVAGYAEVVNEKLLLRAVSFHHNPPRRTEQIGELTNPVELGERVAAILK